MAEEPEVVISRKEMCDALQELYDELDAGYWEATTKKDKDRLRKIGTEVFDVLTELNREDIESRDEEYCALREKVNEVIPRIDKLGKEIDKVIKSVKVARNVAKAMDKALKLAAKYFKFL